MVALNTTVSPFLSGLCDALALRSGLQGVAIFSGPVTDTTGGNEAIEFGEVHNSIDWYALGRKGRKESYDVVGWTLVVKYGKAEEQTIRDARDRAFAILDEINTCIVDDPTVGGIVTSCGLTAFDLSQVITGKNTNARGAAIAFTISVEAIIRTG